MPVGTGSQASCRRFIGWLTDSVPRRLASACGVVRQRRARNFKSGCPPRVHDTAIPHPCEELQSVVIIGIDPHKSSLTAVAIDNSGTTLATRRFIVDAGTATALAKWTRRWASRRFAIEGANGLGRGIAQVLAAADEDVVDVPSTLAMKVRVLSTGGGRKTDPDDAYAWRFQRYTTRDYTRCTVKTSRQFCGCYPSVEMTWPTNGRQPSTAYTNYCANSPPAESRSDCPPTRRRQRCAGSSQQPPPRPVAAISPRSSSLICVASMRTSKPTRDRRVMRSLRRPPPCPRSTESGSFWRQSFSATSATSHDSPPPTT